MAKIEIPSKISDLIRLARKVSKKHTDDADKSPLNLLTDVNWTQVGGTLEQCDLLHAQAEDLMRQAEKLYKERDLLIKPVEDAVKKSRNFLKTVYTSNPKKLGEWGFDVVD